MTTSLGKATEGRDRIRLRVDQQGQARIEVLDAEGKTVFSAPEAAANIDPARSP